MANGPSTTESPYLVAVAPGVSFTSILSVGESGGGDNQMVGIPDGLGAFDNGDGTFTLLMNHELTNLQGVARDDGSTGAFVSHWVIDSTTLEVLSGDDQDQVTYLWDDLTDTFFVGSTAWNRFCSGDLADVGAYYNAESGKGTQERIYLAGEEATEGRAVAHVATGAHAGEAWELPWMGNLAFENLVASPSTGDKTVVMSMDDGTGGQVHMYLGAKQAAGSDIEKAGLVGGKLFALHVKGLSVEVSGTTLPGGDAHFTMRKIGDVSNMNQTDLETADDAKGATEFFRPEDGAWDPSNPNYFYFVTTASITENSKLWRLEFNDMNDPKAGGTIRMMLDGTEGQKMMDNITVTADGKVVICEDPGNQPMLARVWEYDPSTDSMTELAQHDPARFATPTLPFSQDEESSGVIDVTDILGDADTYAFLIDTQAHYAVADPELVQGGQLMVMYVDHAVGLGAPDVAAIMAGLNGSNGAHTSHPGLLSGLEGFHKTVSDGFHDFIV